MRTLPIVWKRLIDDGETCPRCGSTHRNLTAAIARLEPALAPLGIRPVLETQAIDDDAFRAAPAESNRLWIDGTPMEQWLGASAGNSPCCDVCGDLPCRTLELDGQTYEAIPEDLIVKAALIAASRLIGSEAAPAPAPCCVGRGGCT